MNWLKWLGVFLGGLIIGYQLAPQNIVENASEEITYVATEEAPKKQVSNPLPIQEQQIVSPPQNNKALVALEKVNLELRAELASYKRRLDAKDSEYQDLQYKLADTAMDLHQIKTMTDKETESEVSDQDLAKLVPEEYAHLMPHQRSETREAIFDFHQEPEDLGDGFDLSHQIISFIEGHADSFGVEINSVTCKGTTCEMLIKELERPSWHNIYQELITQDWWNFTSTSSSSSGAEPDDIFIYYFLEKHSPRSS